MKLLNPKLACQVLSVLCLLVLSTVAAQAALQVRITKSASQAIPVAIVPFSDHQDLPVDVAKVASHDLETTGMFDLMSRDQMLGAPHDPEQVNYTNWRAVGASNLVVGSVKQDEQGRYRIHFHILNAYTQQTLGGYEVTTTSAGLRSGAHAVANLIYKELTGKDGYFLSRIAYITVTREDGSRLYRLNVADYDGHGAGTIYSSHDPIMSPAWSPDGTHIAYVAFDVARGRSSLRVQEVATGKIRKISSRPGINGAPSWSPNGKKLAMTLSYKGNPDIYIYNLRTDQLQQVTHSPSIDTEPVWSPDGGHIVFTSGRGGNPQLYRINTDGSNVKRVTFTGHSAQDAAFSPDGSHLAFVEHAGNGYRIAVKDLESGEVRTLTSGPLDEGPTFAPNGQAILYATQGQHNALATVSIDGEVHSRLSQKGMVREPSWGTEPRLATTPKPLPNDKE